MEKYMQLPNYHRGQKRRRYKEDRKSILNVVTNVPRSKSDKK